MLVPTICNQLRLRLLPKTPTLSTNYTRVFVRTYSGSLSPGPIKVQGACRVRRSKAETLLDLSLIVDNSRESSSCQVSKG